MTICDLGTNQAIYFVKHYSFDVKLWIDIDFIFLWGPLLGLILGPALPLPLPLPTLPHSIGPPPPPTRNYLTAGTNLTWSAGAKRIKFLFLVS